MAKLLGGILNDVGEHLIPTCIQSRLEKVSKWRFDNIGWHLVPGPDDPNGEGSLPSVQPETPMMQFQVVSTKAGTGWLSEEFLQEVSPQFMTLKWFFSAISALYNQYN